MAKDIVEKDIEELKRLIDHSINLLYENDYYLIQNKVHERTIVFRFGLHFYKLLQETNNYSGYDLDSEYNKNRGECKKTVNFPKGTYPDMILHKRGTNDFNIMIIEFKTYLGRNINRDIAKLKDFTHPYQGYNYKLGVFIRFLKDTYEYVYINDGNVQDYSDSMSRYIK